jgi:hypothetical protein
MNTFQIRSHSREEANLVSEFDPGHDLQDDELKNW